MSIQSSIRGAAVCALIAMLALPQAALAQRGEPGARGERRGAPRSGEDQPEFQRRRDLAPRDLQTIFTPLDLPTPTEERLGSGVPGPAYWQNTADHVIEAELDDGARRLWGRQSITYTNHSPYELDYLWLHLEQNLFHPDSRGARMTPPGARFGNRDGFVGGFEIRSVSIAKEHEFARPVEMAIHDTLGRIDLREPLMPGESVTIGLEWAFNLPEYGSDRMGIEEVEQGTIFQLAQWFPTVVKYDDVYGWNTMPYLGQGEFYTDFGSYEVRLTVPRDHIVAATGVLQNPSEVMTSDQLVRWNTAQGSRETVMIREADEVGDPASRPAGEGPLTWHFKADDVRTFAWTSSDAFIWDGAAVEGSSVNTFVQSVYPKEAAELWKDSTDMLRFAIEGYNQRWLEYPYPTAINANGIVGGMEYPMIVFCRNRTSERGLYGVTTHEIGHNWFPMVINTDERRHAWMDEGFNSFINIYSNEERFGDGGSRGNPRQFARSMLAPNQQPIALYADQIERRSLGRLQYAKVATGLFVLREAILGPERFDFAFNRYQREWAFKSPRPADFFRVMEDAAGEDLDWFWRGWFYETGHLDQAVAAVEVEIAGGVDKEDAPTGFTRITFRNHGELVMPVEYEVGYDDGTTQTLRLPVEAWFNTNEWTVRLGTQDRAITRVTIDPRGVFPDAIPENDEWSVDEPEDSKG